MANNNLTQLVGKTIHAVEWFPVHTPEHYEDKYDDGDYLVITFSDGFKLRLAGNYNEDYTGNSIGEYPAFLHTAIQAPKGYNGPSMYEAKPTVSDPIVEQVICSLRSRSKVGIEKYGTSLHENNTDDFLQHLQEELMDAILYIQKLKSNGPGMYEAKPINTRRIGDEYLYVFDYGGEEHIIQTELFRFYADSLEHAKEILDPEEHAYIKWMSNWPKPQ